MFSSTQDQYSRFPYPPIPTFALPRRGEGKTLQYERYSERRPHSGIRILVAGAGTFEALVVAQANPKAREVIAVDLSEASLAKLRKRVWLHRLARPWTPLAPIRTITADLATWTPLEPFDYILASNLLQHVKDPAGLLVRLSSWLKPDGLLRVVTYPKTSRIWMRETARWLKQQGLDPNSASLVRDAHAAIRKLPAKSPVRSCFESQPETKTQAGLVDAFFNACENPLSPLEWREAVNCAGLKLVAEDQTPTSRSGFLEEILPDAKSLDTWNKLQILDDLLELCANPILWFRRTDVRQKTPAVLPTLPANTRDDLEQALKRVSELLAPCGVPLSDAISALRREVGPRVSAPPEERVFPGLSILDHVDDEGRLSSSIQS